MEELTRNATHEMAPPVPPRWKGIQSLDLVYRVNERCIELLCSVATREVLHVPPPMLSENLDLWGRLSEDARRSLAQMPFVIIEAQFKNAVWWRQAAEQGSHDNASDGHPNGLPREAREHLMHEITMLAWQMSRWDQTVAKLLLGIAPSVKAIIASLTPQQIRVIASNQNQAIQVRWADDALLWRDFLLAARAGDEKRLARLHLHAKMLLCTELAHLRE